MHDRKKIVVIADDFTGAAEIGGMGLRHGFNVAIETEPIDSPEHDLLVIATDTRSMSPGEAQEELRKLTQQILKLNPFIIYKKVDSVLRGNVAEELSAQLDVMGLKRSIIIAGNPIFNRVIKNGQYFIDGTPLNETCFSTDAQHPRNSNKLTELLAPSQKYPVTIAKHSDKLPESGLIMGDVESIEDLSEWTHLFNHNTLFAGASGFFNALLSYLKLTGMKSEKSVPFGNKRLFVLGSSYPKSELVLKRMVESGHYHSNMPRSVFYNTEKAEEDLKVWVTEIITAFKRYPRVIISSIHKSENDADVFMRIKQQMAWVVNEVCKKVNLDEILVEGGSTTYEVLNKLNFKRLTPIHELDTGVIRMKVDNQPNLCLTTKPGSYTWPDAVWKGLDKKESRSKISSKV